MARAHKRAGVRRDAAVLGGRLMRSSTQVVVDLSVVEFIDSSVLNAL